MNYDTESITRRFNALRDTYRNGRFWPEEKVMTRSEAYAEGFHSGRWQAEEEIQARLRLDEPDLAWPTGSDLSRANALGVLRGYRDTWARFDAGTLTWEMLEHAPVNR